MFVGAISDNFDERIEQKVFHAEIVVDNDKVSAETKAYRKYRKYYPLLMKMELII